MLDLERIRSSAREEVNKNSYAWICPSHVLAMTDEIERLRRALDESVKLQSHYAKLLNIHDGGERMQFTDREEWLRRLDVCVEIARADAANRQHP